VGRETGQSAENVRLALELMVARELVELRTLAHPHRPKASFAAEPGRRLKLILSTVEAVPPDQPPVAEPLQNS
jgi:hypothetical protein